MWTSLAVLHVVVAVVVEGQWRDEVNPRGFVGRRDDRRERRPTQTLAVRPHPIEAPVGVMGHMCSEMRGRSRPHSPWGLSTAEARAAVGWCQSGDEKHKLATYPRVTVALDVAPLRSFVVRLRPS